MTGEPLGERVLDLGQSYGAPTVTAGDGRYVVAWDDGFQHVSVATISADGQLEGSTLAFPLVPWRVTGIARVGDTTSVSYIRHSTYDLALLRIRNGAFVGEELVLGPTDLLHTTLGSGAGQVLAAHNAILHRLDPSSGAELNGSPTTFTKYNFTTSTYATVGPVFAFDGENHLVAWIDAQTLYTARVRASDGALLEPDDDFNERSGARKICTNLGIVTALWIGVRDGKVTYVMRHSGGVRAVVLPISPWNETSTCPLQDLGVSGDAEETTFSSGLVADDVDFVNAGVLRLARTAVAVRSISHDTTVEQPLSLPWKVVNFHAPDRAPLGVASSGADFITGYYETDRQRWRVLRVDDETGRRLGPELDYSDTNSQPTSSVALSSNGSGYLVGVSSSATRTLQRLSCRGEPGERHSTTAIPYIARIASDGNRYLALDLSGNVLRADGDGNPMGSGQIVNAGSFADVTADEDPDPERRTFLVLSYDSTRLYAHRIRSTTGAILTPIVIQQTNGQTDAIAYPFTAYTGSNDFLVGWINNAAVPSLRLALVDPVTAQPRATDPLVGEPLHSLYNRFATFDGASLTTWMAQGTFYARRWKASLDPIDPPSGLDTGVGQFDRQAVASNRKGRTLFVFAAFDPTQLGTVIYGQFVDNPLPATGPRTGACDETSESHGGAGGSGGASEGGSAGSGDVTNGGSGGDDRLQGGAGGVANGGSVTTGATTGSGGSVTNGGTTASGGSVANGGVEASGGSVTNGGTEASGGSSIQGGNTDGGMYAEGGAAAQGGRESSGGAAAGESGDANGGGSSARGGLGSGATAGSVGARSGAAGNEPGAGNSSTPTGESGGCGCRVAGQRTPGTPAGSLAAFALLVFCARRRRRCWLPRRLVAMRYLFGRERAA